MHEIINPMKKQAVYAEGKTAFVDGKHRGYNPYKWRNRQLSSIWLNGWDQAKKDSEVKDRRSVNPSLPTQNPYFD
jgi:ribosome modulation factor